MIKLREKIKNYLGLNIKKKDDVAVATARLILAAIKDRDIEHRAKNKENEINEVRILELLQNMIKQRKESVKIYSEAGRKELKIREQKEISIIESFLPEQLDKETVKNIINELCIEINAEGIKDLGKIITILKERYPGELDFKVVAELAKSKLT